MKTHTALVEVMVMVTSFLLSFPLKLEVDIGAENGID